MTLKELEKMVRQAMQAKVDVSTQRDPETGKSYLVLTADIKREEDTPARRIQFLEELTKQFDQFRGMADQYSFATRFRVVG